MEHLFAKAGWEPKKEYKDDHMQTKELEQLFNENGLRFANTSSTVPDIFGYPKFTLLSSLNG